MTERLTAQKCNKLMFLAEKKWILYIFKGFYYNNPFLQAAHIYISLNEPERGSSHPKNILSCKRIGW